MKSRTRDKAISLLLTINLIFNSFAPFLTFARPVVSAEPLKAEIDFKTIENSFDISVNTKEEIEYVLSWKNQDGLQGTSITKAGGEDQKFQRDIYAGIKSGPDARRDTVIRGIYKVEVKSQHWITAIKFSLDDGKLIEENKTEYLPEGLDFTDNEIKWIEEGDQITPTPTLEATTTPTPTIVEQGDILEGVSDQNFMTSDVDAVVQTNVIESYQCRADSLNGCLITDKDDYAPTEVALITGYGFAPNTEYTIRISSSDEPVVTYEALVTTDEHGSFTVSYQLDGTYRPNYLVQLFDLNGQEVARVTFTDSVTSSDEEDLNPPPDFISGERCPAGNVKWEVDEGEYEYNDGSGTVLVADDKKSLSWSANSGYVITGVCVKTGDGLYYLDPANSPTGPFPKDISHVVLTTQPLSRIKVVKDVVPNDLGETGWDFTISGTTNNIVSNLKDGEDSGFYISLSGNYTITESAHTGTEIANYTTTYSCSDGQSIIANGSGLSAAFSLVTGKDVVCTFINTKISKIIIEKQTIPDGSTDGFSFTTSWGSPFNLSDGQSNDSGNLAPGNYSFSETLPPGWTLQSINCSNGNANGMFYLNAGEVVTCTVTNIRQRGNLIVKKVIDIDGDLSTDEDQSLGQTWQFDVDGTSANTDDPVAGYTDSNGKLPFNSLKIGQYSVIETTQTGYDLFDASCDNESGTFDDADSIDGVEVEDNETTTCTFYNTPNGTLHGYKWSDDNMDGGPSVGIGESLLSGWTINLYKESSEDVYTLVDSKITDDGIEHFGWYWFENLLPGNYMICEASQTGWQQTYPIDSEAGNCHLVTIPDDNSGELPEAKNYVEGGAMYNFGNVELSKVTVIKYSDDNGNGMRDENEALLSNWTINLNQTSKVTDNEGEVVFDDLLPGSYDLSETLKDEYVQTEISCFDRELQGESNQLGLEINPGDNIYCQIGNQPSNSPELQISKSNDGVDRSPGDIVTYTIKIKALNSMVLGVVLKDLLPEGFVFQNVLSIIKNGTEDMTESVGNPDYASPGTYNLGDMNEDDEIVVKYTARIDGAQEFGLYKDIAWAKGTDTQSNKVLASAQPEGYVDDNFVGTAVRVNGNYTEGGNVFIAEEGQVLGASTTMLPATGADGMWVTFAGILIALGLSIIVLWFMIKQKKMKFFVKKMVVMLLFGVTLFATGQVYASDLSIRLSEPKTPTKNSDFKLVFTILDLTESGNPITAKCFYKKNLSDGWTQFDSDKNISAGGNSDFCQVNSGIVNTSGQIYYFKATADNGSASDDSELQGLVSVTFDDSDPGAPTNYKKEKISSCQYKISFKTANDGMTSRVEIYRSESTSMKLDGSTRVGDVAVSPDTENTFTESVPDCNKTYYYIVRAFNPAGNASGPIGDSVTITTTIYSSAVSGETTGAIPVVNVTLAGGTEGEGQVLGEDKTASESPTQSPEEIDVKGASTSNKVGSFVSKNRNYIAGLLALIIAIGVYVFIKKRKTA